MSVDTVFSARLVGRRLLAFRLVWILVAAVLTVLFFSAVPYRYAQLKTISPQADTTVGELLPEEAAWLLEIGLSPQFHADYFIVLEVVSALPFYLVAGIIFLRKSDNLLGMTISLSGIFYGTLVIPVTPALLTVDPNYEVVLLILRNTALFLFVLMFLIFPDGRFYPRWTRYLAVFYIGFLILSVFIPVLRPPMGIASFKDEDIPILLFSMFFLGISSFAQYLRYRYDATRLQKQQTKWLVYGTVASVWFLILGAFLPAVIFPQLRHPGIPALQMRFFSVTLVLLFAIPVIPVTMAFSILRYRLWDIDLVIRRTLQYALVTGGLGLVYFAGVTLLQNLFTALSGQESPAAVVLSTLAIAALFNPMRKRVQEFIDQRFYRQKYSAELALAGFSEAARSEADLVQLSKYLIGTVNESLQPEHASLWIAPLVKDHDIEREDEG